MVLAQWSDISRRACRAGLPRRSVIFDGHRNKSGGNPERQTRRARKHVGARKDIRSGRPSVRHRVALQTHAAVEAAASEGGLTAEVRDLLKEVLADVEIVEDASFKRRADRALAEYDGIVKPGQNIVYEYRWQAADGTWSSWRRTPETGELDYPNEAREIQHRIAAAPGRCLVFVALARSSGRAGTTLRRFGNSFGKSEGFALIAFLAVLMRRRDWPEIPLHRRGQEWLEASSRHFPDHAAEQWCSKSRPRLRSRQSVPSRLGAEKFRRLDDVWGRRLLDQPRRRQRR
jgi:hypothetical protein